MPTKPLDRLMFAQGGLCFFCREPLSPADASVEHLVASANGGENRDANCVACCKSLNFLLGSMSLKEKIQVVLNQKGQFHCPLSAQRSATASIKANSPKPAAVAKPEADRLSKIVTNLKKLSDKKPSDVSKLRNTINSLYQNQLKSEELQSLVKQLEEKGNITVTGNEVTYSL
jgi:hypothetical protein